MSLLPSVVGYAAVVVGFNVVVPIVCAGVAGAVDNGFCLTLFDGKHVVICAVFRSMKL